MTDPGPLALHAFAAAGQGVPLVLLPGFPLDHRMWADVAALVPPGRRVVAVDPPGLGASPPAADVARGLGLPEEPSLDTAADALAATLGAAGIDRAIVAGLSMGGYTALALLERHPALVAGLALVDTRSTPDDESGRATRRRVADEVLAAGDLSALGGMPQKLLAPANLDRLAAGVAAWIEDQSPEGVAWSQRAMAARPDRTALLTAVTVPVLVVVGDEDRLTPVVDAEHMVAAHPGADLVVVPGAGHLSTVEAPAAVAEALARLASQVDARR